MNKNVQRGIDRIATFYLHEVYDKDLFKIRLEILATLAEREQIQEDMDLINKK